MLGVRVRDGVKDRATIRARAKTRIRVRVRLGLGLGLVHCLHSNE